MNGGKLVPLGNSVRVVSWSFAAGSVPGLDHLEVLSPLVYRLMRCLFGLLAVLMRSDLSKDARVARDFRANRAIQDVELAQHVAVIGDTVAPFMAPPDTDPAALRAAVLPDDPWRPPRRSSGDGRRSASPTSSSALTSPTRSLRS
jgi:hypothetical protein